MKRKDAKGKRGSGKGGWLFLAIVVLMYAISAIIDWDLTQRALDMFIPMADKIAPTLILVFVLMFVINLFLNPKKIEKYLGKQSGLKGWFLTITAGVLSTGPVYAWYTILADLKQQGMKSALIVAFIYSRAVKLPLLPLMIHYFGITYTSLLCLYLIGFSIVSGIVMQRLEAKGLLSSVAEH